MKPHAAVLSSAALLGLVSTAGAAPGDPRVVQGTVEWAEALSVAPFVVVRGDDGRFYYTDVSRLQGARLSLSRGERVVVTGVEGMSPHELAAVTLQSGVAPSVALTPPPSPVPSPPPAAPAPLPLPAPVAPPAGLPPAPAAAPEGGTAMPAASPPSEPAAHRLDGRVQSITGNLVVLKTADGRRVTVNMGAVGPNIASVVQPGDELTVFGRTADNQVFVATGYVHVTSPGSALPGRPR